MNFREERGSVLGCPGRRRLISCLRSPLSQQKHIKIESLTPHPLFSTPKYEKVTVQGFLLESHSLDATSKDLLTSSVRLLLLL